MTGLPLPRYASLKTDRVNLREGPSKDHATTWVFQRAGLPVEITAEFETWRKVRDSEGAEGWVLHSLLSGRRTALVAPWQEGREFQNLHAQPRESADLAATLQSGVIANIRTCDGAWCLIDGDGFKGYIEQVQSLGRLSWREDRIDALSSAGAARGGDRRRPARPATISANARAGCASTR